MCHSPAVVCMWGEGSKKLSGNVEDEGKRKKKTQKQLRSGGPRLMAKVVVYCRSTMLLYLVLKQQIILLNFYSEPQAPLSGAVSLIIRNCNFINLIYLNEQHPNRTSKRKKYSWRLITRNCSWISLAISCWLFPRGKIVCTWQPWIFSTPHSGGWASDNG